MIRLGAALFAIGAAGKVMVGTYRKIKNKEFFVASALPKDYFKGGFQTQMSRREAFLILNLREGCEVQYYNKTQQIKERHRSVMLINHPDNGNNKYQDGSTYVATKVNEAKELLLKA